MNKNSPDTPTLHQFVLATTPEGFTIRTHNAGKDGGLLQLDAGGTLLDLRGDDEETGALLRHALQKAPQWSLSALRIAHDHPRATLARELGFVEEPDRGQNSGELNLVSNHTNPAATNSHWLLYQLPPNRQHNTNSSPLIRLEGSQAFIEQALALVHAAEREICILSDDLEPWLYDHESFASATLELLSRHRHSRVRILVQDTTLLQQRHHRLLALHQRATERVELRKFTAATQESVPFMLLTDRSGVLFRKDKLPLVGSSYQHYPQRNKTLREQFEQWWQRSSIDPQLQTLKL